LTDCGERAPSSPVPATLSLGRLARMMLARASAQRLDGSLISGRRLGPTKLNGQTMGASVIWNRRGQCLGRLTAEPRDTAALLRYDGVPLTRKQAARSRMSIRRSVAQVVNNQSSTSRLMARLLLRWHSCGEDRPLADRSAERKLGAGKGPSIPLKRCNVARKTTSDRGRMTGRLVSQ